jgi:hypothetical protein
MFNSSRLIECLYLIALCVSPQSFLTNAWQIWSLLLPSTFFVVRYWRNHPATEILQCLQLGLLRSLLHAPSSFKKAAGNIIVFIVKSLSSSSWIRPWVVCSLFLDICWFLHLNCRCPMFRHILGLYVKTFLRNPSVVHSLHVMLLLWSEL